MQSDVQSQVVSLMRNGSLADLMQFLEEHPALLSGPLDDKRYHATTLLKMAVIQSRLDMLQALLERGAQPFQSEKIHHNLLYAALQAYPEQATDWPKTIKLLIEYGVKLPLQEWETCMSVIESGLQRVYIEDADHIFALLLDSGFDPVAVEHKTKCSMISTVLNWRYDYHSFPHKLIETLLALGCSLNPLARDHRAPLLCALDRQQYQLVEKLLDHGAAPDQVVDLPHNLAGYQQLPVELRDRLLHGLDLSTTDNNGRKAVHAAIGHEDEEYLRYLIARGEDINSVSDYGTCLLYAVTADRKKMIPCLIELGADVNARNAKGETVLDVAQSFPGFKRVCAMLVKGGAKTSMELAGGSNNQLALARALQKDIHSGEAWADKARTQLTSLSAEQMQAWHVLIRHCLDNNSAKPSAKWSKDANTLIAVIGTDSVRARLLEWLPLVKEKRTSSEHLDDADYYSDYQYSDQFISENNTRLLKGLAWAAGAFADDEMARTLRELAATSYKKVYGIGMRNAKIGNAAIYSLSAMPGNTGVKELIVLRSATKYNPALVNINRVFDKLAETRGLTPDELAELSVPDYGLTGIGLCRHRIGEFEALVQLTSVGKCELTWQLGDKVQKSIPAAVKSDHPAELKALKGLIKDVQTGSSAHTLRLEQMYLRPKPLDASTWLEQYIDHRLIGYIARRLIWRITASNQSVDVIHTAQGFSDRHRVMQEIPANAAVQLWHPSMSAPEEVLAWRKLIIDEQITQPFKQAHREIYLLTDAERSAENQSLRFANHVLKQAQFHALATQRGWSQQRGGMWDGGQENSASKRLPAHNMEVELEATGADEYDLSNSGMYECVITGPVRFIRNDKLIALESIEPLLFSELMRDVDLFVGVASIGNDPTWRDRQNRYWASSSFGELNQAAKTRMEVVAALIPKLAIASQLKVEGRFLLVEGKLTSYKIHLGSGNILMAPNDAYLCIVPGPGQPAVMLPFEGDAMLSVVLSKAMLLANDHKIKDSSILSQINVGKQALPS
ncbi:MAG: DUF4132 domain-containing protein [Pseudomonas sp.]